ncbi:toprim domain-containing protein [Comamonas granuli]|uniref:toprim domain-containing protein n=1 Tax=Comamonas granuli TaxID=290309 RepID=UPI001FE120AA|nr:toprim domain-containing protein [Comamonas granuli]
MGKIIDRLAVPVNDTRRAYMEFASMLARMESVGLEPHRDIDLTPDGKLHRYRVRGDKPGSKNGWFVLHGHPVLAGAFGSWKTGESHNWREARDRPPTPQEREALRQVMRNAQAAREAEQVLVHEQARTRAAKLWGLARLADDAHPYLQRKQIRGFGVRQLNGALLVPARDAAGVLHTLQFIQADGSKRFLTGGRIQGCYYAMGRPGHRLLLAEGFATAATVFMATGEATACAFNAGNLLPVARALRAKFPHVRIVVAADDDSQTPGNPGVTKATEAARAVGGFVAVPRFDRGAHGV